MATGNNRDVRLGIEIATAGEDDVRRLAAAVRALGQEGDPVAAEFNRLADQLERLSKQAGSVQAVQALGAAVDELAASETRAAAAVELAGAKYREQAAATAALREAQSAAAAEVATASAAYNELRAELDRQVIAGKAAGQSQKELAKSTEEARLNVVEQGLALKTRNTALAEANAALKAAESAESKLRVSYEASSRAATATATALQSQAVALDKAQAGAVALGVDVTDLAAAEASLRGQIEQTVAAARDEAAGIAAGAEAMRRLEQSAREADAQMAALAASLRETEQATRQYTTATAAAAGASADDAAAAQTRVRAAEALIASEAQLTAAQRALANERNVGRAALVAEAQAYLESARAAGASRAATQALVQDATRLGTALDGTSAAIRRVGTLSEEAFGRVGVRSLQAIEAEVNRTEIAVNRLNADFRAGRISADDLARALGAATVKLNQLSVEAKTVQALPTALEGVTSKINGLISKFAGLGAAIATVGVAVKPVLDATIALQQLERTLTTVTGISEKAHEQIVALRQISQESGQSFTELAGAYAKFAASALQSGLTLEQTQSVFRSVSLAAGNLGLSSDQAKRALEALSQIASKGVVQMEELRQQLGDALPGVLPLLAKELGLTQAQLIKVVESGQLLASEAIPAIGRALEALQPATGVVDSMVASWARFKNVVLEAGTVLVEGPIGQAAGAVLGAFAGAIRDVTVVAVGFNETLRITGRTVGLVAAALTGNIKSVREFGEEFDRILGDSAGRMAEFERTAYGADKATKALGGGLDALGSSFAKLAFDQQAAIDAANLQAQSAEKNVQGKKAEAQATETLASLIGDETSKRIASLDAARLVAQATEAQAKADEAVVAVLVKSRDATIDKAKAEGVAYEQIQATVQALNTKIAKAEADASKTNDQAAAARAHAAALEVASLALADNSKRIDEFKQNVDAAQTALFEKIRAMEKDAATSKDVQIAAENLAKAKGLLRDAIDDVTKALDAQIAGMKADAELQKAAIELEIAKAKNALAAATAAGDYNRVRQESIRILELEQTLVVAGIGLKKAEATATLEALARREAELRAAGQMTDVLQTEIDLKRKAAQAQALQAEAAAEGNKARAEEVKGIQAGTVALDAHTAASTRSAKATRDLGAAMQGASADAARLGVALRDIGPAVQGGTEGAILAFERLKSSGKASSSEIRAAFVSMANEVIAASSGIVPEWVKVEAATYGARVEVDEYGDAVVRVAEVGGRALAGMRTGFDQVAEGARNATAEIARMSAEAKSAADKAALSTIATRYVNSPAYQLQKKGGAGQLGEADVAAAQQYVDNALANLTAAQRAPGSTSPEGMRSLMAEYQRALALLSQAQSVQMGGGYTPPGAMQAGSMSGSNPMMGMSPGPGPSSPSRSTAPSAGPSSAGSGGNYSVTINLGGRQTVIGTSTQRDAEALRNFLAELEYAAARSGS